MKKYHMLIFIAAAAAAVFAAGCTSSSSNSNQSAVTSTASQNPVSIQNYAFNPSALTISKGANVTWKNEDSVQHNIVSDTNAFSSPLLNKGDTYTHQFNATGTFPYHCGVHPYMKATIVVT